MLLQNKNLSMLQQNFAQMLSFGDRTSSMLLQNIVHKHVVTKPCSNAVFWQQNIEYIAAEYCSRTLQVAIKLCLNVVFWQQNIKNIAAGYCV